MKDIELLKKEYKFFDDLDEQVCKIEISRYGYTREKLRKVIQETKGEIKSEMGCILANEFLLK